MLCNLRNIGAWQDKHCEDRQLIHRHVTRTFLTSRAIITNIISLTQIWMLIVLTRTRQTAQTTCVKKTTPYCPLTVGLTVRVHPTVRAQENFNDSLNFKCNNYCTVVHVQYCEVKNIHSVKKKNTKKYRLLDLLSQHYQTRYDVPANFEYVSATLGLFKWPDFVRYIRNPLYRGPDYRGFTVLYTVYC